jgi:isoleucyl-tRNA synthetase
MKAAAQKIDGLSGREIQRILDGTALRIDLGGKALDLTAEDVIIQRSERENLKVLNQGSLTVAIDPQITDDLAQEGLVRDLVRHIQNLRKERGLEVSDRIRLSLAGDAHLRAAVDSFDDYLMAETLAVSIDWGAKEGAKLSIGDADCVVALEKV